MGRSITESHRNPNDLSAFDKHMGIAMLNGELLSAKQKRSRYMFFTRFGGGPRLLPESRVYFRNPLIRFGYRVMFYKKIQQAEGTCRLASRDCTQVLV